jgi:hypothetical protein
MANEEVKEFMGKLADTELFDALTDEEKDKVIFTSSEFLKAIYGRFRITTESVVAFQVLYDLEAKTEHYQHLKRHGVTSFSSKGVSVSFKDDSNVSPQVIGILGNPPKGAKVGRLM